jgi:hypothetical protein
MPTPLLLTNLQHFGCLSDEHGRAPSEPGRGFGEGDTQALDERPQLFQTPGWVKQKGQPTFAF